MQKVLLIMLVFHAFLIFTSSFAQPDRVKDNQIRQSESAVVLTQYGFVRGTESTSNVLLFLGIPYAAPPIGDLRWKAPIPPKTWSDTLAAISFGPSCPQLSKDNDPTSEDCLYLNIFTTKNGLDQPNQKKPVMFWIHGGGFLGGSAKGYDGHVLATKGVVVVTINYRLGPFGYLFHPALEASEANKGAGNYGLLDQIAALKWVRENISKFGGDPNNVTIWGESAGAFSVGALLATPLARGLFHRAILESGTGLINGIQTKNDPSRYAVAGAESFGIKGNDTKALKALYSLSAEQLLAMYTRPRRPQLQAFYIWFSPVVDGWALPLPLDRAINEDKWNKVPLLIGSNEHEGAYFQNVKPANDIIGYYQLLGRGGLDDTTGLLRPIYDVRDSSEIFTKSQEVVGDFGFGAPARALARMATKKNGKAFLYYFTRTSIDDAGKPVKALHSTELPFVFGFTLDKWIPYKRFNGIHKGDAFLADAMSDYWVSFARYGHPNGNLSRMKLPMWPLYESENNSYLEIGQTIHPGFNLRKREYDAMDKFSIRKGEIRY